MMHTCRALGPSSGAAGVPGIRGLLRSLLAISTLLLSIAAIGPAYGDTGPDDTTSPGDQAFLSALSAAGIKYAQPDQAVKAGHALCDLADNGKTDDEIIGILSKHNTALSEAHANTFMDIAYGAYCPRYLP